MSWRQRLWWLDVVPSLWLVARWLGRWVRKGGRPRSSQGKVVWVPLITNAELEVARCGGYRRSVGGSRP